MKTKTRKTTTSKKSDMTFADLTEGQVQQFLHKVLFTGNSRFPDTGRTSVTSWFTSAIGNLPSCWIVDKNIDQDDAQSIRRLGAYLEAVGRSMRSVVNTLEAKGS